MKWTKIIFQLYGVLTATARPASNHSPRWRDNPAKRKHQEKSHIPKPNGRRDTRIDAAKEEAQVQIANEELFSYPHVYMTGHGNVAFSAEEAARLRHYLEAGGFLHADDNYGMDESFRREMRKVFPSAKWVELPADHPLFSCHFKLPDGLPKVHAHDGKRPQALALFVDKRIAVLYTYEADLGDGWEDPHVHDNPETRRRAALEMGANIAVWALSR